MISKVITYAIGLANGTTAAKKSFPIDLPSDFKTVRGFYVIRNSGAAYLKITIRDQAGNEILASVNINHLVAGSYIEIAKRFFTRTPFKCDGTKAQVSVENFATLGAAEDIDLVLIVDNKPEGKLGDLEGEEDYK